MHVDKIAIYTRVSTEDQAKEGYSLEVQREYLESFANREGYEVFKVYCDDGVSAYSTRRPALQELLKDAKDKKFELVLVYKIGRFSRNLKDLLMLVDELSSYGVGFKSATEPFDTTTSAGKLMFQQLGSFAEFERNRLAERVMPGMIKGVQLGNRQGARYSPFGCNYNKQEKVLEVSEKQAPIVKMIFPVSPLHGNERIDMQQGLFLCQGSNGTFEENIDTMDNSCGYVIKIIISPGVCKEAIIGLNKMNINNATLFPGLDGYA